MGDPRGESPAGCQRKRRKQDEKADDAKESDRLGARGEAHGEIWSLTIREVQGGPPAHLTKSGNPRKCHDTHSPDGGDEGGRRGLRTGEAASPALVDPMV